VVVPKKRRFLVFTAVAAGVCAAATTLLYLLSCGPAFFNQVDSLTPTERAARAKQFLRRSTDACNQMTNDPNWDVLFNDVQVNAWLAEDFTRKHSGLLPAAVSDPRVSFGAGRVSVAFRMRFGPTTSIITVTGRLWLPKPNVMAFEVESVRAGRIPLPRRSMIATATAAVNAAGLELEWKRHGDRPVALLHCPELGGPNGFGVEQIELQLGVLYVAGRSMAAASDPRDGDQSASVVSTGMKPSDQSPERVRVR
jgi:hypothetical protein